MSKCPACNQVFFHKTLVILADYLAALVWFVLSLSPPRSSLFRRAQNRKKVRFGWVGQVRHRGTTQQNTWNDRNRLLTDQREESHTGQVYSTSRWEVTERENSKCEQETCGPRPLLGSGMLPKSIPCGASTWWL